jgi:NADH:ubiquinone oxidoreductase subunit 5 (subunit L)/multisubunit Na+/H+ antiporter MnhA subunit
MAKFMMAIWIYVFIVFIVGMLTYKYILFFVNHFFTDTRGYSERDRKQMVTNAINTLLVLLVIILMLLLMYWDNHRIKYTRLEDNKCFVQETVDSNIRKFPLFPFFRAFRVEKNYIK